MQKAHFVLKGREIETIGSKGFCGTERVVTGLDRKPLEALNLRKH